MNELCFVLSVSWFQLYYHNIMAYIITAFRIKEFHRMLQFG